MVYNYLIKGRDIMKKVAIIGLGLMGGSVAKALKKRDEYTVLGADCDELVLKRALEEGVISSVWNGKTQLEADITLLCIGPSATKGFIENSIHLLKRGSILSDICGVKSEVVDFGERVASSCGIRFVGGHPMAGRERSGYEHSVENLFLNRSYIFTKTQNTDSDALGIMSAFAYDIGCSDVTVTSPEEHDRMIAFTSQLPHVLAGAYIKSPKSDRHKGFSAGSYHDVSRVASVDENLWTELFLSNKENLICEIETLIDRLTEYKRAIETNDCATLKEVIKQGRLLKERDITVNGNEKPHKFG